MGPAAEEGLRGSGGLTRVKARAAREPVFVRAGAESLFDRRPVGVVRDSSPTVHSVSAKTCAVGLHPQRTASSTWDTPRAESEWTSGWPGRRTRSPRLRRTGSPQRLTDHFRMR